MNVFIVKKLVRAAKLGYIVTSLYILFLLYEEDSHPYDGMSGTKIAPVNPICGIWVYEM